MTNQDGERVDFTTGGYSADWFVGKRCQSCMSKACCHGIVVKDTNYRRNVIQALDVDPDAPTTVNPVETRSRVDMTTVATVEMNCELPKDVIRENVEVQATMANIGSEALATVSRRTQMEGEI